MKFFINFCFLICVGLLVSSCVSAAKQPHMNGTPVSQERINEVRGRYYLDSLSVIQYAEETHDDGLASVCRQEKQILLDEIDNKYRGFFSKNRENSIPIEVKYSSHKDNSVNTPGAGLTSLSVLTLGLLFPCPINSENKHTITITSAKKQPNDFSTNYRTSGRSCTGWGFNYVWIPLMAVYKDGYELCTMNDVARNLGGEISVDTLISAVCEYDEYLSQSSRK